MQHWKGRFISDRFPGAFDGDLDVRLASEDTYLLSEEVYGTQMVMDYDKGRRQELSVVVRGPVILTTTGGKFLIVSSSDTRMNGEYRFPDDYGTFVLRLIHKPCC